MRSLIVTIAAAVLAVIGAAGAARADTLQLKTGDTLVGDVRLGEGDAVVVEVRWPETKHLELRREDLAPESLLALLDRSTDKKDAAQRRALGEEAERLGFLGAAAGEYAAVKALDPSSAKEMDARLAVLAEAMASDLFDDANALLEDGRPSAALLYFHTLVEKYPHTAAAKLAKDVMAVAHRTAGASTEVAQKTVSPEATSKVADEAEDLLRKGDALRDASSAHAGARSVADARALERAIDRYEAAWSKAIRLPVAGYATEVETARAAALRSRAKERLVRAYLETGTVYLQRRAIPAAERLCNKACDLDPENRGNHALHALIVQAKSVYGRVGGRGGF